MIWISAIQQLYFMTSESAFASSGVLKEWLEYDPSFPMPSVFHAQVCRPPLRHLGNSLNAKSRKSSLDNPTQESGSG